MRGGALRAMTADAATRADDALPGAPGGPVPPAGPPIGGAGDPPGRFALGMALTPFARLAVGVPLGLLGGGSGAALAIAARMTASFALAAADRRDLACAGRPAPGIAWALLPEGYLLVRARRLGRTPGWFWLSLGCEAAAYVVGTILLALIMGRAPSPAPLPARPSAADPAPVLPQCNDRSMVDDVLATFDDIAQAKAAGLRGISLTGQAEVGQGPGAVPQERVCDGVVEASNTGRYDVSYGFEIVQGRLIVRVALR